MRIKHGMSPKPIHTRHRRNFEDQTNLIWGNHRSNYVDSYFPNTVFVDVAGAGQAMPGGLTPQHGSDGSQHSYLGYVHFNTPFKPNGADFIPMTVLANIDAHGLPLQDRAYTSTVNCYLMDVDWNPDSLTFNNRPAFSGMNIRLEVVTNFFGGHGGQASDMTVIWRPHSGGPYYGFGFQYAITGPALQGAASTSQVNENFDLSIIEFTDVG